MTNLANPTTEPAGLKDEERERLAVHFEAVLRSESDRGACVVAGALVEEALRALVSVTFIAERVKGLRALGRSGALGTLNGAIEYAYAMGLISEHEREEAVRIRDVRNAAAHALVEAGSWTFASLGDPPAWAYPFRPDYTEREKFAVVTAHLVAAIWPRVGAARQIVCENPQGGRASAIAWLLESVERPILNRTYLALFDADPPSDDDPA